MKEVKYVITDPVGFHARPAGQIAKDLKAFASAVTVFKGDKSADMKKLLKVM
ncbi:MAG: HPr family phosphocarrier protein, partial [Stomatobaculum sp.]|nr:HPr family phosphocarrier protein [Stomatobaculum sp.]